MLKGLESTDEYISSIPSILQLKRTLCKVESLSQVDGACDSPLMQPGKCVEVEGVELEEEERSMKGWCQVRNKISQEEKEAAAETRG